jgi:hypothetical protein
LVIFPLEDLGREVILGSGERRKDFQILLDGREAKIDNFKVDIV